VARIKLSKQGFTYLSVIMAELGMELGEGKKNERPDALRIAFAKGLTADSLPDENEKKDWSDFEAPTTAIAKENNLLLFKHLMINRLGKKIPDEEIEKYISLFIDHGLKVMYQEIQNLTHMDNYIIYLWEKHANMIK